MQIGIVPAQHAHRARDMKPAQRHLHAAFQQRLRQVERVRELIRLHADHHHHARTCILYHPCQSFRMHARVRLIERMDLDLDLVAEDVSLCAIAGQPIDRRQRIRRDGRAKPLNHVPVIVVMRWLHQN